MGDGIAGYSMEDQVFIDDMYVRGVSDQCNCKRLKSWYGSHSLSTEPFVVNYSTTTLSPMHTVGNVAVSSVSSRGGGDDDGK